MKHILFVDDDRSILDGLRRMLHRHHDDWTMSFAVGGAAAMEAIEAASFDVVVTDMRMPDVDGATLLRHLRDRSPSTVRIILSGHSELAAALRSVPVAHCFLSKPCDRVALVTAIRRSCDLQDRLSDPRLRALLGEMDTLPSAPHAVLALNRLLSCTDVDLDDVADVIGADPAMAAKLLQLVNSAFFGVAQRVAGVRDAVAYLGIEMVRTLTVAAAAFRSLPAPLPAGLGTVEALQSHSVHVAHLARALVPPDEAESAFMAGLLHDVGVLALATCAPDLLRRVQDEASTRGTTLSEAESYVIGATHADVGAYLLAMWGLPYAVVDAVANHERAPSMPHRTLDAVHATYVAEALAVPPEGLPTDVWDDTPRALDPEYVRQLGLDLDDLAASAGGAEWR